MFFVIDSALDVKEIVSMIMGTKKCTVEKVQDRGNETIIQQREELHYRQQIAGTLSQILQD